MCILKIILKGGFSVMKKNKSTLKIYAEILLELSKITNSGFSVTVADITKSTKKFHLDTNENIDNLKKLYRKMHLEIKKNKGKCPKKIIQEIIYPECKESGEDNEEKKIERTEFNLAIETVKNLEQENTKDITPQVIREIKEEFGLDDREIKLLKEFAKNLVTQENKSNEKRSGDINLALQAIKKKYIFEDGGPSKITVAYIERVAKEYKVRENELKQMVKDQIKRWEEKRRKTDVY